MAASAVWKVLHLETELVPLGLVQRFRKHFSCTEVASLDAQIAWVRAVKSAYELAIMGRAGAIHQRILEVEAPGLLHEGMSEAEFACELYSLMVRSAAALRVTRRTRR
jgi:Xaa-Pro aminopeptidase